jgi:large subunit ribosomal protein L3
MKEVKPLGFLGYKVGMTHVMAIDNRSKSTSARQSIAIPVTIIECPPVTVMGISFYKKTLFGLRKISSVLADNLDKTLRRKIQLPKKKNAKIPEEFDDLRLIVHTQPSATSTGNKKPQIMEIAIGGSKEEKLSYAQEKLGKPIMVEEVFQAGASVDVHGNTTGKGFQGTVKRYGVPLKSHKNEKGQRGIGNLGAWTPKRVDYRVALPGKMGYHRRTEYNKQILKIGTKPEEINKKGGMKHYGLVKGTYLLVKGSIIGPPKRVVTIVHSIRPNKKMIKEVPEITYISQ